jgi:hypothetical protein
MYPGYGRPRDVLDEYARTFFAMLNEGYRQRYEHYYFLAELQHIPMMQDKYRKRYMKQLEWASKRPGDILNPSSAYATAEEVKKFFKRI